MFIDEMFSMMAKIIKWWKLSKSRRINKPIP